MTLCKRSAIGNSAVLGAILAAGGTVLGSVPADAGGFAVREQSASFLGMAFAGAAAGSDLSSGFWNPAAFGTAERGITTESHYSAIFGDTKLTGTVVSEGSGVGSQLTAAGVNPAVAAATQNAVDANLAALATGINNQGPNSTTIDRPAVLGASYGAYRVSDKMVLGISLNSPFGLSTEPDNSLYTGSTHGLNSSLLTFNVAPTISYEVMRGLHVAAGIQLQFADLAFKFRDPTNGFREIDVRDEVGVGWTAGLLWKPNNSTALGVGFRSMIKHDFEGELNSGGGIASVDVSADLEIPEIVTVSLSQAITPSIRAHVTYEWTNWSRFDSIPVTGTTSLDQVANTLNNPLLPATDRTLDGPWADGHFVSGGLEYDYNQQVTLRSGVAWEKSPIRTAEARLLQVPDSDRVWLSFGATYRWSEMTTIDFAYTHIFFEDAEIDRANISVPSLKFQGEVDNSANIFAVSLKTKWGENGLQNFLGSLVGAN